ncbi:MAG: 30S ribosomal protein S8e [Candidatus Altiarchaeota archaeon]|nr:30S ribosomal protein S8e [Candidatus Altiarchaeota archaeon]
MYHGKITRAKKKRKYNIGRKPAETTIGPDKKKEVRVKGGGIKIKLAASEYVNAVLDGKNVKCRIVDMVGNPANKDYTRRRIITKGAVLKVQTSGGKEFQVRVTSRPGQTDVINAVSI